MKKIIILSIASVLAGGSLAAAQSGMAGAPGSDTPAQAGYGHRGDRQAHHERFLAEADTNNDGTVSDAEKQAFRESRGKEHFAQKDQNGDGSLSKNEVPNMPAEVFAKLDTNNNGSLTPDELKAGFGKHMGHRGWGRHGGRGHFADKMFERVDQNNDGRITRDELRASADQHFAKMDKNNDGSVTREEIEQGHPGFGPGKARGNRGGQRGAQHGVLSPKGPGQQKAKR